MNLKSLFLILWLPMPIYATDLPEPPPFWKYEAPATPQGGSLAGQAPTADVPSSAVPTRQPFEPEMVDIPAGEFTMGCDSKRDDVEGGCVDDEKPAHKVSISAFKLARTETTVAQYMDCVDKGGCPTPEWREEGSNYNIKAGKDDYYKQLGDALTGSDYPVVGISWDNASAYAKWLSKETGMAYRLPTEAEWEYAARGGTDTAYPWGNSIGKNNANCSGDLCGDKFDYTSPVGSFAENPFHLRDMHGNVWEWVSDWKGDYVAEPQQDPQGVSKGSYRVLRGGSWHDRPWLVRSADRNLSAPDSRSRIVGIRVAQGQRAK